MRTLWIALLAMPIVVSADGFSSPAQNFVDLSTAQTVAGSKTIDLAAVGARNVAVGSSFVPDATAPLLANVIEASLAMNGSTCQMWHRILPADYALYYRTATDAECRSWSAATSVLTGILYPYVWKSGSTYYLAAEKNTDATHLFMWSSPDGVTWTAMNGGAAVLNGGGAAGTYLYAIANPAIAQVGTTLYLLLEGKKSTGDPGLLFASTTMSALNFNTNITSTPVIDHAGNAMLVPVPDRSALLAIYGDLTGPGGIWRVLARYASTAADLTLAASWNSAANWTAIAPAGINATDPTIMFGTGKNWPIVLQYVYNQADTWQQYAGFDLDAFYDVVTASDANVGQVSAAQFVGYLNGNLASGSVVGPSARGAKLIGESQSGTTYASDFRVQLSSDASSAAYADALKIIGSNKYATFAGSMNVSGGEADIGPTARGAQIIGDSQSGTTYASRVRLMVADDTAPGTYNAGLTIIGSNRTATFGGSVLTPGSLCDGNGANCSTPASLYTSRTIATASSTQTLGALAVFGCEAGTAVTATGAALGNKCLLGTNSDVSGINGQFSCVVTATNTVKPMFCGLATPPSIAFSFTVIP